MPNTFVTPWTVTCQNSLSMGFPKQEYWSGLPFLSLGNLLTCVSWIGRHILYHWATREAKMHYIWCLYIYTHTYIHIHIHVYIYMCVCVYIYIYIYSLILGLNIQKFWDGYWILDKVWLNQRMEGKKYIF